MDQAVTTRQDVDERAELGNVHNAAGICRAKFSRWRINDCQDPRAGIFYLGVVWRTDGDDSGCSVVRDIDLCAGLLLNCVDDLALWPDDFADLV